MIEITLKNLNGAVRPKEVFGNLSGDAKSMLEQAKVVYRQLVKATHEDKFSDAEKPQAKKAFQRLQELWDSCQKEIQANKYDTEDFPKIKVGKNEYKIIGKAISGDICNVYACESSKGKSFLKISKKALLNRFLVDEAAVLNKLHLTKDPALKGLLASHIPTCIDSFTVDSMQANVVSTYENLWTLEQVRQVHPNGVDSRTLAWMFRRLLAALGAVHERDVVHGAVVPTNFMICPDSHNGFLIDWCYAVNSGKIVKAISPQWKAFYPPEILSKKEATPTADIYMAAMCMLYISGGDVEKHKFTERMPKRIEFFLRACLIESPTARSNYALDLHKEFGDLLEELYGKPKFHPFEMPTNGKL